MRCLVAIVAVGLAPGCVASLTPAGSLVQRVPVAASGDVLATCEFLGTISASENGAWGNSIKDRRGALNKVRNEVAERGGDAYLVVDSASDWESWFIEAEAFNCGTEGAPADVGDEADH